MAHTSLQVCMDSSDWLQGTMSEDLSSGLDSTSSPPGGTDCMLAAACSSRAGPPLMERRLRPPHDQNLKCPRCDSTHTKFCYYNNYSLSQPRYFCKTCRRYWTKGGTLRNIPVGGGCRKNKKSSSKKSNNNDQNHNQGSGLGLSSPGTANSTDLHLSFPEVQLPPHLANLIGAQMSLGGGNFMEGGLIRPIDFMDSKYEALVGGGARGHDFMGNNGNDHQHQFGAIGGSINMSGYNGMSNTNGFISAICSSSPFGVSSGDHMHEGNNNAAISFMDQRLLLPYDANDHQQPNGLDVKPSPKLLSLEWQDSPAKDTTFGYNGSLNSWSGMLGAYQTSTTNSMV